VPRRLRSSVARYAVAAAVFAGLLTVSRVSRSAVGVNLDATTVSHELRTPLNAVLGWATLLSRRDADADTVRRAADAIERGARAQAQLVDDILDIGDHGRLRQVAYCLAAVRV
jgi:signal transduction histidine kinase